MQLTTDELLFILDALKRRELELTGFNKPTESYKMAISLQERIMNLLEAEKVSA